MFTACQTSETGNERAFREYLDLSGEWQFQLDPDSAGFRENWFARELTGVVRLPGSLDENGKGYKNTDTTTLHLNRPHVYYGPAWFRKTIRIPDDWAEKRTLLVMERTKVTHVWLDSLYLGSQNTLLSPQTYDLSAHLILGVHTLTIVVNNNPALVPVDGSHAYAEHTQTNWNGIIGDFHLEACDPVHLERIRTYPDVKNKMVRVTAEIKNMETTPGDYAIRLTAQSWNAGKEHKVAPREYPAAVEDSLASINYPLGDNVQLWSEFSPALYKLNVELLRNGEIIDRQTVNFGMREFSHNGDQFVANGKTIFLRGKHEGCVFPLTGYPAMDVEGWARTFRIAKEYGINHYRFHSWCPPEAAFMAADMAGIYLQPELPVWYGFNPEVPEQMDFMMKEGKGIMDSYGNYASFVMFALGNEIHRDRKLLKQMVDEFRAYDGRRLYAQGSNNWLNAPAYWEGDDFWVTFRTGVEKEGLESDVRASMSFHDSKIGDGGLINTFYPSTIWTYKKATAGSPVPVVSHETGQYQVYPDFTELNKYTGALKPWNLEKFRDHLARMGMAGLAGEFQKASGALSTILYRAEIEAALRTPGFGGFQLLDLQDFPGQGTALVGILDAFMDSKGLIEPEEFRRFNNAVVPLLLMEKYCWTNDETFRATLRVVNYGAGDLADQTVSWRLESDGTETGGGSFRADFKQGTLSEPKAIEVPLSGVAEPQKLELTIVLDGTEYANSYPVWVYPATIDITNKGSVSIVSGIQEALEKLSQGADALIFPDHEAIRDVSVGGLFITDFWNWEMFQGIAERYQTRFSPGTMGLLIDNEHPVFRNFPTDFHSDWQWWAIAKGSRPMILDETDREFRPIVQTIDNISRNHKLGLIYEFKCGAGRAVVCAADLQTIDKPEAKSLYAAILGYMNSGDFNPAAEITPEQLRRIFGVN